MNLAVALYSVSNGTIKYLKIEYIYWSDFVNMRTILDDMQKHVVVWIYWTFVSLVALRLQSKRKQKQLFCSYGR